MPRNATPDTPFLLKPASDPSPGTRPLRVALVSNAPPRQCGIATFAGDIARSLAEAEEENCAVEMVPLLDEPAPDGEQSLSIQASRRQSYRDAARALDARAFDAVWLQHEFGIFGGDDGEYVLDLAVRLATPLVVTFHTVLANPSANQRRIVEGLARRASRMMVMSRHGRQLLASHYSIARERIEVIEHGAPDRPFRKSPAAQDIGETATDTPRLATFGLIGPGKGIEHVIDALPTIAARVPDVQYRIIGATHPNLVAREGEAYRDRLKARIAQLGVEGNVTWIDAFLEMEELLGELQGCDIYVSPYPNLEQTVSGTLAYALAMGRAIVATPYVHARELLGDGTGWLVEPGSPDELAQAVNALLSDPARLGAMQERAYRRGRSTIWPQFARRAAAMLRSAAASPVGRAGSGRSERADCAQGWASGPVETAPALAMTDRVGMVQHARFGVPDRRHGYAIDDNARALILCARLAHRGDPGMEEPAMTYAAFLQDAWNAGAGEDGHGAFRNFMGFDCRWLEKAGSEDSQGRTFWALGEAIETPPAPAMRDWAIALYDDAVARARSLTSPRAMAFAMLGACARLRHDPDHDASRELVSRGADELARALEASRRPDWAWFERLLAYDNTRLSEALIRAGQVLAREDYAAIGLETLEWIAERQMGANGVFRPIGSDTFDPSSRRTGEILPFDQQPLESQAFIEACLAAARAGSPEPWRERAQTAWEWFFGRNDRGEPLVDMATGRCYDGLTPQGRNRNSGAESILAFMLSHVAIQDLANDRAGASDEHSNPIRAVQ